jgi:transcriptional regulator of met regulon
MHQEALNFESGDTFYSDLCEAFTAFLAKYTDRHIPDDSTLRKNYIPGCYKKIMGQFIERELNI